MGLKSNIDSSKTEIFYSNQFSLPYYFLFYKRESAFSPSRCGEMQHGGALRVPVKKASPLGRSCQRQLTDEGFPNFPSFVPSKHLPPRAGCSKGSLSHGFLKEAKHSQSCRQKRTPNFLGSPFAYEEID